MGINDINSIYYTRQNCKWLLRKCLFKNEKTVLKSEEYFGGNKGSVGVDFRTRMK